MSATLPQVPVADVSDLAAPDDEQAALPPQHHAALPPPPPPVRHRPAWLVDYLSKPAEQRKEELKPEETGSLADAYRCYITSNTNILQSETVINNERYCQVWLILEEEERLNYMQATGMATRKKKDNVYTDERKPGVSATKAWMRRRESIRLVNTPGVDNETHIIVKVKGVDVEKVLVPYYNIVSTIVLCHRTTECLSAEKTFKRCQELFVGIPQVACTPVKSYCSTCIKTDQEKKEKELDKALKASLPVETVWGRVQADLIDMRSTPSLDPFTNKVCSWILHVKDHGSRFSILVALERKTAKAVARELVRIFQDKGAPRILHTDNGKEFKGKAVVDEMMRLWPGIKFIHGKPRRPQTQGLIERGNKEVKKLLRKNITRSKLELNDWARLLGNIAFVMNTTFHKILGDTPFNLMYGRRPSTALLDAISSGVLDEADLTEEDLENLGISKLPYIDGDGDGTDDDDDDDDDDDVFGGEGEEEMDEGEEDATAAAAAAAGAGAGAQRKVPSRTSKRTRRN